ncbi:MAG: threonylcarbamoyl-AMP synthase [Sinobacteraceae bacterium]|nr:threonylcarbamoyl-AMP synthase [Nevskiaceae bacterium]
MNAVAGAAPADIDAAVAALRAGELVAFPTETVYGLGADARNPAALRKIYALKGRPSTHPLILHLAAAAQLPQWVATVPPIATVLAERFWPGPLTLVLPRAPGVPDELTGGQDSVAVRVPSHPVAQALLTAFGGGIAAPSANRYGRVSPTHAEHVREEFPQGLLVLEGGPCAVGLESTIVSLLDASPRVLRPGAITRAQLEQFIGPVSSADAAGAVPRVPGSTVQHYAPQTPVSLLAPADLARALADAVARGERIAVMSRGESAVATTPTLHWQRMPDAAADYGQQLYATLRRLDKLGVSRILVERVPAGIEWDAIRDRLNRAAATFT